MRLQIQSTVFLLTLAMLENHELFSSCFSEDDSETPYLVYVSQWHMIAIIDSIVIVKVFVQRYDPQQQCTLNSSDLGRMRIEYKKLPALMHAKLRLQHCD